MYPCLAPSHYLNQRPVFDNWIPENSHQWNSKQSAIYFIQEIRSNYEWISSGKCRLFFKALLYKMINVYCRADSRLAPSQWETSLQSNAVSHWLCTKLEPALHCKHASKSHVQLVYYLLLFFLLLLLFFFFLMHMSFWHLYNIVWDCLQLGQSNHGKCHFWIVTVHVIKRLGEWMPCLKRPLIKSYHISVFEMINRQKNGMIVIFIYLYNIFTKLNFVFNKVMMT